MPEVITIGKLAKRSGVGVETIRFYEREGLVPEPPRTRSGYRQYPPEAAARIRFIRRAQELGFSLKEITELLQLRIGPGEECGPVREIAARKVAEVDGKIADLERMRHVLDSLLADCPGEGPLNECPILDALDPGAMA